jgi:hypothetical protein
MRYSSGRCEFCPSKLQSGFYWGVPGFCTQSPCRAPNPGEYLTGACGVAADATVNRCALHLGNPEYPVQPFPPWTLATAQYYCPGGVVVPQLVPANARVKADYTGYDCNDGYFVDGTGCRECPRGSACKRGATFQCPAYYYAANTGQSVCNLCASTCRAKNHAPLLCPAGSTQNAACVVCGLCGSWPDTGYNCAVGDSMALLPPTWTP